MPFKRNKSNYKLPIEPAKRSELNMLLLGKLKAFVRAGNHLDVAARAAGVHPNTFFSWLQRGEKEVEDYRTAKISGKSHHKWSELSLYAKLFDVVDKAVAQFEAKCVDAISNAGKKDWRAMAWLLERRHKVRWSEDKNLNVEQVGTIQHVVITPKECKTIEEWEQAESEAAALQAKNKTDIAALDSL